jgi:hypothetical protein
MAQVKLLKIDAEGLAREFNSTSDDITLNSFTIQGGGPVLSGTGLDLNNQDVSDIKNALFNNPATGYINATAGNIIVDDLMAKDRNNVMQSQSAILFGSVTNLAGLLDSFKIPNIAGAPTATPAFSSDAGYMVYDSSNKNLYAWDGTAWDNLNSVSSAEQIDDQYIAGEALVKGDVVYISAANTVSKADNSIFAKSRPIGVVVEASVASSDPVTVRKNGFLPGMTLSTVGARQYLDAAGALTETVPVGSGNTLYQIGYAKSLTDLDLQIMYLGRRA